MSRNNLLIFRRNMALLYVSSIPIFVAALKSDPTAASHYGCLEAPEYVRNTVLTTVFLNGLFQIREWSVWSSDKAASTLCTISRAWSEPKVLRHLLSRAIGINFVRYDFTLVSALTFLICFIGCRHYVVVVVCHFWSQWRSLRRKGCAHQKPTQLLSVLVTSPGTWLHFLQN